MMNKFDFAQFEVSPWNARITWRFPYYYWHSVFGHSFQWVTTSWRLFFEREGILLWGQQPLLELDYDPLESSVER